MKTAEDWWKERGGRVWLGDWWTVPAVVDVEAIRAIQRDALDAAEKVVEAAREVPLDDQYGPDTRLGQALAEYDKLKEEK